MTILEAKQYGKSSLKSSPSPALDTECFLKSVTGKDKTFLLFHQDTALSEDQEVLFDTYLKLRQTGMPVAYILGRKEFFGYDFTVNPDVLIPKPDTELLVEKGLEVLEEKLKACDGKRILKILDMCTGSGCVGISLLKSAIENNLVKKEFFPHLTLADISEKALDVARTNAKNLLGEYTGLVTFVRTNLFDQVFGEFDLILSNPPYIPSAEAKELLKDGRSEPLLALDGDIDTEGNPTGKNDGLGIMENLTAQAPCCLAPQGVLLCESGEYNAEQTQELFKKNGLLYTEIFRDLEGQLRVTKGVKE